MKSAIVQSFYLWVWLQATQTFGIVFPVQSLGISLRPKAQINSCRRESVTELRGEIGEVSD